MEKKSKIIIILFLFCLAAISFFLHSQYGVFYSSQRRKEVGFELTQEAEDLINDAKFPETEKTAKRALRFNPGISDAYLLLARSLYAQERLEEAVDAYLAGLGVTPERLEMNFYLANTYRDLEEFDLAKTYYEKSVEIDPQNIAVWHNYAMSYSWDQEDKEEEALEVYKRAVEANPDDEWIRERYESLKQDLFPENGEEDEG